MPALISRADRLQTIAALESLVQVALQALQAPLPAWANATVKTGPEFQRVTEQYAAEVAMRGVRAQQVLLAETVAELMKATPVAGHRKREPIRSSRPAHVGGRAAAGWDVSINGAGPSGDPVGAITALKPGDTASIVNSAPEIVALNAGSSSQAPAGFVEQTVARVAAKYARLQ